MKKPAVKSKKLVKTDKKSSESKQSVNKKQTHKEPPKIYIWD